MPVPILFITIVAFTIWLNIMLLRGKKNDTMATDLDNLLNEEQKANLTRRKPVPQEVFFTPCLEGLPFRDYGIYPPARPDPPAKRAQKAVRDCAAKEMIRFETERSNIDLKKEFGAANLELIIRGESNYEAFIRALTDWSEALLTEGAAEDAQKVLESALRNGSDLSRNYYALTEIYTQNKDAGNLRLLLARLESGGPGANREKLIEKINAALERKDR
ncbi:MAG: hypothetical protein LBS62_06130 [Clostridiales bacterium]|jgi:hypothetical protein|nr:hypothetical protein [Clostridiales bacterium]